MMMKPRLASGEGAMATHLGIGENGGKGEASTGDSFYRGRRERGGIHSLIHRRRSADGLPVWGGHGAQWHHYPGSPTGAPRSGFQTWHEPEQVWAALFIGPTR
jgi:hypothetical protein